MWIRIRELGNHKTYNLEVTEMELIDSNTIKVTTIKLNEVNKI